MSGDPLLDYGLVAMEDAFGFSGGAGGVVHDGEVVLGRLGHVEVVGVGVGHQLVVVEVAVVQTVGGTSVFVDGDDIFERLDVWQDAGDFLAQVWTRDEVFCAGVEHAVAYGVGAECGEEGCDDAAGFEDSHCGDVELGQAVHEDEYAVAEFDAEVLHDGAEAVGFLFELGVGVAFFFAVFADPDHCEFVAVSVGDVAVDSLVSVVQAATREPIHVLESVSPPVEVGAR